MLTSQLAIYLHIHTTVESGHIHTTVKKGTDRCIHMHRYTDQLQPTQAINISTTEQWKNRNGKGSRRWWWLKDYQLYPSESRPRNTGICLEVHLHALSAQCTSSVRHPWFLSLKHKWIYCTSIFDIKYAESPFLNSPS